MWRHRAGGGLLWESHTIRRRDLRIYHLNRMQTLSGNLLAIGVVEGGTIVTLDILDVLDVLDLSDMDSVEVPRTLDSLYRCC
jgi:hypothetical protein